MRLLKVYEFLETNEPDYLKNIGLLRIGPDRVQRRMLISGKQGLYHPVTHSLMVLIVQKPHGV